MIWSESLNWTQIKVPFRKIRVGVDDQIVNDQPITGTQKKLLLVLQTRKTMRIFSVKAHRIMTLVLLGHKKPYLFLSKSK